MTSETRATGIVEQNGVLIGPCRRPRNLAATQRGSIHDDATAQKLGFRGGTVRERGYFLVRAETLRSPIFSQKRGETIYLNLPEER